MFFDEALSNWREVLGGISKTNISIDINDLDDEMEEMFSVLQLKQIWLS